MADKTVEQTPAEKVEQFLTDAGVFYFTTADGDQPKCRPFSFHMLVDGVEYFGFGAHKDVYRQFLANPKVEVCAMAGDLFLRYWGTGVECGDPALLQAAFETMPFLRNLYNDETGNRLAIVRLADATAQFRDMMGVQEEYRL